MAWVMCLTRPPTSTVTSGAAEAATTSAISRSASSALGAFTSTTRAPAASSGPSGSERWPGQPDPLGVARQGQLPHQQVLGDPHVGGTVQRAAPRVSAP